MSDKRQCVDCGGYDGWQHLSGCRLAPYDNWRDRIYARAQPCRICREFGPVSIKGKLYPIQFAHLIGQVTEAPDLIRGCLRANNIALAMRVAYAGVPLCRRDHMIFDIWVGMLPNESLYSQSLERWQHYESAFVNLRDQREDLLQLATLAMTNQVLNEEPMFQRIYLPPQVYPIWTLHDPA
jgi:hypothetical protein